MGKHLRPRAKTKLSAYGMQKLENLKKTLDHADHVNHVLFSPDGKTLTSARFTSYDPSMGPKRPENSKKRLTGHGIWIVGTSFSPDGKTLATMSRDETIRLWDANTGQHKMDLTGGHVENIGYFESMSFSPDGKHTCRCEWQKN